MARTSTTKVTARERARAAKAVLDAERRDHEKAVEDATTTYYEAQDARDTAITALEAADTACGRIVGGRVPVPVRVGRPVHRGPGLTPRLVPQPPPEPVVLDVGEVLDESGQCHGGGPYCPFELPGAQPRRLPGESRALIVEEAGQRLPVRAVQGRLRATVPVERVRHGGHTRTGRRQPSGASQRPRGVSCEHPSRSSNRPAVARRWQCFRTTGNQGGLLLVPAVLSPPGAEQPVGPATRDRDGPRPDRAPRLHRRHTGRVDPRGAAPHPSRRERQPGTAANSGRRRIGVVGRVLCGAPRAPRLGCGHGSAGTGGELCRQPRSLRPPEVVLGWLLRFMRGLLGSSVGGGLLGGWRGWR